MIRKGAMRNQPWLKACTNWNVDVGLACGLPGHAQIGKGMWAMPDMMAAMLEQKNRAAASRGQHCPGCRHPLPPRCTPRIITRSTSPSGSSNWRRAPAQPRRYSDHPGREGINWSPEEVQQELDNNARRAFSAMWCAGSTRASVAQRCPTSSMLALMEDAPRITRISSQHIANWLRHGITSERQVWRRSAHGGGGRQAGYRRSTYLPMARILKSRSPSPRLAIWCSRAQRSRTAMTDPARGGPSLSAATGLKGVVVAVS